MRHDSLVEAVERFSKANGGAPVSPSSVSKALGSIKHVLVGGFAIPIYTGKVRATMDVDMVVADTVKAEAAIAKAFPKLVKLPNPGEDVTRYAQDGQEVINLLHPIGVFKIPLAFNVRAMVNGKAMNVVSFEAMLVGKFLSFKSRHRDPDGVDRDRADLTALINSRTVGKGFDWKKIEKVFRVMGGDPLTSMDQTMELRRLVAKAVGDKKEYDKRISEERRKGRRIVSG
jgi:hypothetical protein